MPKPSATSGRAAVREAERLLLAYLYVVRGGDRPEGKVREGRVTLRHMKLSRAHGARKTMKSEREDVPGTSGRLKLADWLVGGKLEGKVAAATQRSVFRRRYPSQKKHEPLPHGTQITLSAAIGEEPLGC